VRVGTLVVAGLFLVLTIGVFVTIGLQGTAGAAFVNAPTAPTRIINVLTGSAADRAGFRPGDIVLSVDGLPTPNYQSLKNVVWPHRPGETLRYDMLRPGATPGTDSLYSADITLQSVLFAGNTALEPLALAAVGLLITVVAATVTLLRPDLLAARLLLLASAGFAFSLNLMVWRLHATDPEADSQMWLLRVLGVLSVLGPAALLHLFLVFPRRNPMLVRLDSLGPRTLRIGTLSLLLLVYALPIAISILQRETYRRLGVLYGPIQAGDLPLMRPLPGQQDWVAAIVFVVVALLGGAVLALLYTYFRTESRGVRAQVRWILGALAVLLVSEVWGRGLPVAQNYLAQRVVEAPAVPLPELIAWVALPAAVGAAVVRNQLFDIRLVLRATLLYAPLTLVLVAAYLGLVFVLTRTAVVALGPVSSADPTISVVAALAVAALAYPMRQKLQGLLQRTFYRDQLARKRFLDAANDTLGHAQSSAAVAEFLTGRTVDLVDLTGAWLAMPASWGLDQASASQRPPPEALLVELGDTVGRLVLRSDDAVDSEDAVVVVEGPIMTDWYAAGARVLVPLRGAESSESNRLGVWLLGARRSGAAFDRDDLRAYARVAHQAAVLLENAQLQEEQVRQAVVQRELGRAREIQRRLMPKSLTGWPGRLEIAARFRPASETSGDFYDLLPLGDSEDYSEVTPAPLLLALGDVAGKGIAAALVTALARTALRAAAEPAHAGRGSPALTNAGVDGDKPGVLKRVDRQLEVSPAAILDRAGAQLHRDLGPRDFVACALAVVEPQLWDGAVLRLANAGQVPPLLCRGGQVSELVPEGERLPLGVLSKPMYKDLVVGLESGDVVVLSSDGLPEAVRQSSGDNGPGELFGFERLAASAVDWAAKADDAEAVADGMWGDVTAWGGEDAHHDDMTLLVLRVP
jgi:serine phosphatase RsbU (regulator of sigma subunit)